ncbi:hypothetical protein [Gluconobacter kondonii]|uniref:Transposase n=1 Tax=Gluconobacter kondonii TaxID=941463 RepID=A0ABQ5WXS1_9PROT|nr:hypothetical protein [Gluconobacter kondonii]GLQ67364.1 hypothetical protein GCM10007870_29490 [Gluconobacter kondonii]
MAHKEESSQPGRQQSAPENKLETLNFKVPTEFKKAYKGYTVAQSMTMVGLLREGFELSKARRGR